MLFAHRKLTLSTGLLASVLMAVAAEAQENVDCGYPLTNSERTYCAEKALSETEADMRKAYDRLHARLVEMDAELPEHLKGSPGALEEAQAAWKAYSDKDCAAYSFPFRGGTQGSELYRNCIIVLTLKRTEDLNATVEDYGN
ncbi:lysozyme inhibitor LprI family protein [Labrenzia sp. OB1]|uniref:lysozyme inhibitor LprI family protein n=1 Tax=Labrenzia sp. OB1 TaxID=1561204 RepID=UPI0007B222C4|nr:lysozyme inhibitor LprI family protein [Labrenzia sp. OB1]KZM51171.1 urease accessory protein [Labrenzia sp. OB1]